jgi:hypothetical protein
MKQSRAWSSKFFTVLVMVLWMEQQKTKHCRFAAMGNHTT